MQELEAIAIQDPKVAVPTRVCGRLRDLPVDLRIDQERSRDFIPVKRIMRCVLVIALDLAGVGVESERRVRVVVAGPLVSDPGARIPRTPVGRVRGRIIDPGNPSRSAASFVGFAFPGVATRLVGRRHRVGFPDALSGERVEGAH